MKVKSFEEFWADEMAILPLRYHDSTMLGILKLLAERAWKQSRYTSDNADRG